LEKWINGLEMMPATDVYRGKVVLPYFSKALSVGRAVCALVDKGFPAEAFGVSRTLVDMYFGVRYMSNQDTDERITTYVEYEARVHEEWLKIAREHFPNKKIALPIFHEELMEMAKKFKSKHQWTKHGGQAAFMALEKDSREQDEKGDPFTAKFDYDVIYFWTSQYVHATIKALDGHACTPGTIFRIGTRKRVEQVFGPRALFNVLVFLSKIVICGCRVMHEDQPEKILRDVQKMMKKHARRRQFYFYD
jgi:hypothetical protein